MPKLTPEFLKKLKQSNVSKDTEKTKERVAQDVKGANKEETSAILALSRQAKGSFYRIYKTGVINARIVLAIAQVLNVDPRYYTGETDSKEPADSVKIRQFLKACGYDKLLKELGGASAKRESGRKDKAKTDKLPAPVKTKPEEPAISIPPAAAKGASSIALIVNDNTANLDIPKEEAVQLIEALYTQAKYSDEAKKKLSILQHILTRA